MNKIYDGLSCFVSYVGHIFLPLIHCVSYVSLEERAELNQYLGLGDKTIPPSDMRCKTCLFSYVKLFNDYSVLPHCGLGMLVKH